MDRLWLMDRPLVDRQTIGDGQTSGRQTDRQAMDEPSVNRLTVRQWTDLRSTDRPSGNGWTFGQQTERQALDGPPVNRQTVRRWTDLWSTDRPSVDGLVEDRRWKIKVHRNSRLTMAELDTACTSADCARRCGAREAASLARGAKVPR
jgi:hypothetical protein